MRSAYVVKNRSEPEFTNYAATSWGGGEFCETLDYLFLSPEWSVKAVRWG